MGVYIENSVCPFFIIFILPFFVLVIALSGRKSLTPID